MDQLSGVIPESVYAESKPIRKIAREILAGRRDQYSSEEIERVVKQRYFAFESLVPLTRNEEGLLCKEMTDVLRSSVNEGGKLRLFLESDCYVSPKQDDQRQDVYTKDMLRGAKNGYSLHLMTKEEKLVFLEDPMSLEAYWHEGRSISPFAKMGYRHFDDYSISRRLPKMIRQTRAAMGRKDLRVLDLGGGVGLALSDIKKKYPELITYNATRDEEFSHYPSDFHVVAFMERMPLELQGSIDVIFSNMATRYLAYTDLVVQGCVSMLAKGGIMDVFFASERSDNPDENDIERRMKKAHDFLKDMESSRMVELEIKHSYTSCVGGSFKSDDGTLYPAASVFVRKL
jgi:hypothetical protein